MTDLNLKELGRAVSEEFTETSLDELLSEQESFLNAIETVDRPNRSLRYGLFAAAAAIILVGTLIYLQVQGQTSSEQAIGRTPRAIGHQIIKKENGQEVIQFDGGSRFTLGNETEARVVGSSQKEVVVKLESGSVHCNVKGNGTTRWIVRAGARQVLVTGTEFVVTWNPLATRFEVDVSKGSVRVTGEALNADGIRLAAGENIVVDGKGVSISDTDAEKKQASIEAGEVIAAPVQPEIQAPGPEKRAAASKAAPEKEPGAKQLTYKELWKLGSQARYKGNYDEAFEHFLALQNRFPGKPYAKQATFLLGRICQEQRKSPLEAKKWFEKYLRISPSSGLAEQSVGRLIQICRKADNPCAREYASWYKRHYPNGAFAELAQSVLE